MIGTLINKTHVRKFILEKIKNMRGGDFPVVRVSSQALETLEAELRARIVLEVSRCPSKGKTFVMPVL
jgi:hypothetical protein